MAASCREVAGFVPAKQIKREGRVAIVLRRIVDHAENGELFVRRRSNLAYPTFSVPDTFMSIARPL